MVHDKPFPLGDNFSWKDQHAMDFPIDIGLRTSTISRKKAMKNQHDQLV